MRVLKENLFKDIPAIDEAKVDKALAAERAVPVATAMARTRWSKK